MAGPQCLVFVAACALLLCSACEGATLDVVVDVKTLATGGAAGTDASSDADAGPIDPDGGQSAAGVVISRLEINQGTAITLVDDSSPVEIIGPKLIPKRKGLFRAMWQREPGFQNREIEARLVLYHADGRREILRDMRFIDGPPDSNRLDGSFRWLLDAAQLDVGTRYSVGLFETEHGGAPVDAAALGRHRVPNVGSAALPFTDMETSVRVVLVPIDTLEGYTSTLDSNLAVLSDIVVDLVPASHVGISVSDSRLTTSGVPDDWLMHTCALRNGSEVTDGAYYLGVADLAGLAGNDRSPRWNADGHCAATAMQASSAFSSLDATYAVRALWALFGVGDDCTPLGAQGYSIQRQQLIGPQDFDDVTCGTERTWATRRHWDLLIDMVRPGG